MHHELWQQAVDWEEPPAALAYTGTLREVLQQAGQAIAAGDPLETFLWASRLVNGGVSCSLTAPDGWTLKEQLIRGARDICLAAPESRTEVLRELEQALPDARIEVRDWQDRNTWRCTDPWRLSMLTEEIRKDGYQPDLLLGAAYGAIRPGLLLSELLHCDVEFIRYSRRKEGDAMPLIGGGELSHLAALLAGRVLVLDEDIASGGTLRGLAELAGRYAKEMRTACVRMNWDANFKPDYCPDIIW